jgi:hypothetical protein
MQKNRTIKSFFYVAFLLLIVFILLPVPNDGDYTKEDWYIYYCFTEKEIKNAPKISTNYHFTFVSPDGSRRKMNAISFKGGDIRVLRAYLKSLGYYLHDIDDNGKEENWFSAMNGKNMFTLWQSGDKNKIILTKITE